jgi:hypothetical protein
MKLSENTIEVLKNFSTINQGLIVKKGSHLKTLSTNKNIKAEADIAEEFTQDFAIYDLNKTLGILSMNKASPEVVVEKECLTFSGLGGHAKIRQRFAAPCLIFGYDKLDKKIEVDGFEVDLTLTQEVFSWIFSVASILKCPNIVIRSVDGKIIEIFAEDVKGEVVDDASIVVQGNTTVPFNAVLKIENLKIIPGAYNVLITNGISKFCHKTKPLLYWISLEAATSWIKK